MHITSNKPFSCIQDVVLHILYGMRPFIETVSFLVYMGVLYCFVYSCTMQ